MTRTHLFVFSDEVVLHHPLMLTSIDLFSGLGGISHALRGFVQPACYCDIDPICRTTLEARIASGDIPDAPVLRDVRDTNAILAAVGDKKVDMIISSSSCVGFSQVGAGNGLGHPETKLFLDVLDLLQLVKAPMLFMENVRAILTSNGGRDYRAILKRLSEMGYRVTWCTLTAEHVGGWHRRSRWFALAYKPRALKGEVLSLPRGFTTIKRFRWTHATKPVERLALPRPTCPGLAEEVARRSRRMKMLGNAVVPDCVRLAFMFLYSGGKETDITARKISHQEFESEEVPSKRSTTFPTYGISSRADGKAYAHTHGPLTYEPVDLHIVINPNRGSGGNRALARKNKKRHIMDRYMTPRAQNTGHCMAATYRCLSDLGSQTRFMRGVPHVDGQLNPRFVEFLMGFPRDWSVGIGGRRRASKSTS